MASKPNITNEVPLAYSVTGTARQANCSRAEVYNRINRGELRAKKLGRRTIVLHDDLQAHLANLPDYTPAAA